MIENVCCFTGHRLIYDDIEYIQDAVSSAVQMMILNGVSIFISGGAIGFDTICAKIIIEKKKENPDIKLYLALPCHNQDYRWNMSQKAEYKYIIENADKVEYISDKYSPWCMHIRNRYMVDNSKYVIAYCKSEKGGTFYTVNYAKKKNKIINNIIKNSKHG